MCPPRASYFRIVVTPPPQLLLTQLHTRLKPPTHLPSRGYLSFKSSLFASQVSAVLVLAAVGVLASPQPLLAMERGSGFSFMKYGTAASLAMVLLAYWLRPPGESRLDDRLDTVLSSLLRAESKVGINNARPRVAIGEHPV